MCPRWGFQGRARARVPGIFILFQPLAQVRPRQPPGHGAVCDAAKAERGTGDYLDWLVTNVQAAAERWDDLEATAERLGSDQRWAYLQHFDPLRRANINRTYVQIENGELGEMPLRPSPPGEIPPTAIV